MGEQLFLLVYCFVLCVEGLLKVGNLTLPRCCARRIRCYLGLSRTLFFLDRIYLCFCDFGLLFEARFFCSQVIPGRFRVPKLGAESLLLCSECLNLQTAAANYGEVRK